MSIFDRSKLDLSTSVPWLVVDLDNAGSAVGGMNWECNLVPSIDLIAFGNVSPSSV